MSRKLDLQSMRVSTVVGSASKGYEDGPFTTALFRLITSVFIEADKLYIIDTNNNAIRTASTITKKVSTYTSYRSEGELGAKLLGSPTHMTAGEENAWYVSGLSYVSKIYPLKCVR